MFLEKKLFIECLAYENFDIKSVISSIDNGRLKIALILDSDNKFVGTVTDGDIRRALLKGLKLNSPITKIIKKNCLTANPNSTKRGYFDNDERKWYFTNTNYF